MGEALDQGKVYLVEKPPSAGALISRYYAREYPNGDLWDIGKMLFESRSKSGSGAFDPARVTESLDRCLRAHVWVVEADIRDIYLDEDAPGGTNNLERSSEYARHAAASSDEDRVVSCGGTDPMSKDFRILRHYKAGSGERIV